MKGGYKEPELDQYGQVVVPRKWYVVWSWWPREKMAAACFAASLGLPVVANFFMRRPVYSSLPWSIFSTVSMTTVGYGIGWLYERRLKVRDKIIDHYVELHPNDFEAIDRRTIRQYKDILMAWVPVRAHERPIPWMNKKLWDEEEKKQ